MQFLIALSVVLAAAAGFPAQAPAVTGTDDLPVSNASRAYEPNNAGLFGFGSGTKGGEGGAIWTVWDAWALRDALESEAPRIVYVRGRIDLTVLFAGSPGVQIFVGSFKTIVGGDANAEIFGGGLRLRHKQHVIIQNLKITNAVNYAVGEQPDGNGGILSQQPGAFSTIDAIEINSSEYVWVDHCELSDDPWISVTTPDNRRRHHSLIGIKLRATFISISNNIFRNHNMNFLIGNSDSNGDQDIGKLKTTIYYNWFQGTTQRNPRVRFGEVHVLNNLYTDLLSYGIGLGVGAKVYGERNVFINVPLAWTWASGQAADSHFFNLNNILTNSKFDAVSGHVGWEPSRYYNYTPMANANVEAYVKRNAGTW